MKIATVPRLFTNVYKAFTFQVCIPKYSSSKAVDVSFSEFKPDKNSSSTPIIILHGFLGSKQNWRGLAKAIVQKSGRQVFALDARNHGDSPHTKGFSYELMAEDVKHFMKKLSIPKAVMVGHSMGGRTVMNLALNQNDLVDKLIVIDVSPIKMPESSYTFIPAYMAAMKKAISIVGDIGLTQARKVINEYLEKSIPEESIRQFLLTNLVEKNKTIMWKHNADVLEKTFESEICSFSSFTGCYMGETLFICGGKSPYVKEEDYPAIQRLFPKAQFIVVPGAGHWVHSERPADFLDALCYFL